ncbi:MAG: hypothetical protein JNK82_15150 [Myxococcaceae bacterium]|nr:hypothetical protein [Myxococcaceae bacterium]
MSLLLLVVLAAAPVRFDCSAEIADDDPRRIFLRAPSSWSNKGRLSADGREKLTKHLRDSNELVVKKMSCRQMKATEKVEDLDGYLWVDVKSDGALIDAGPDFGPPLVKRAPVLPPAP